MDIETRLEAVFAKKVKAQKIDKSMDLEGLGLDSLDKIELLYDIEDEFGIEFSNDEMQAFQTVGDVFNSIEAKLKK